MNGNEQDVRRWSIGELARATGITVRTLYHYDGIGLLTASERTPAGHRRYTEKDLHRLYRIRSLRALGLSLEETAAALAGPADGLAALEGLLTAQLDRLAEHADRIGLLRDRLGGLLDRIRHQTMPDAGQFMATLEMISVFDSYFSPEQRSDLAARAARLGPEEVEAARSRWAGLVQDLLHHVQQQTPAEDPQVQALVASWDAIADRFNGGDEGVKTAAQSVWQDHSEAISQSMPWPADQMRALVDYLRRVRQAA